MALAVYSGDLNKKGPRDLRLQALGRPPVPVNSSRRGDSLATILLSGCCSCTAPTASASTVSTKRWSHADENNCGSSASIAARAEATIRPESKTRGHRCGRGYVRNRTTVLRTKVHRRPVRIRRPTRTWLRSTSLPCCTTCQTGPTGIRRRRSPSSCATTGSSGRCRGFRNGRQSCRTNRTGRNRAAGRRRRPSICVRNRNQVRNPRHNTPFATSRRPRDRRRSEYDS